MPDEVNEIFVVCIRLESELVLEGHRVCDDEIEGGPNDDMLVRWLPFDMEETYSLPSKSSFAVSGRSTVCTQNTRPRLCAARMS